MRVLIVEDEVHIAEGLKFNLEAEGIESEIASSGESALEVLSEKRKNFDAVVLDVMLPGIDGFEVAIRLRSLRNYIPVLMLTARNRPEDVLRGFEAGADDYLPKPFDLSIFLARLNGLLRRKKWFQSESAGNNESPIKNDHFQFGSREIDFNNLELRGGKETIRITLMEAKLLRHLIENEGRAVSRKEILEEVWDLHEETDTRAIDNFVVRLRRYIEENPSKPKILQTVRGVGYRFVVEK